MRFGGALRHGENTGERVRWRRPARLLAAAAAAAGLLAGAVPAAAAARGAVPPPAAARSAVPALAAARSAAPAGTRPVSYLGYTFHVPATWQVVDLAAHPGTCVRFDRHAVYLGTPAINQACPAAALGTTGALLVQPAPRGAAATAVDNTVARQITVNAPRVKVTATYAGDRSQVLAILASAALPAPVSQAPARPRFTPAALRAWASSYTGKAFDACTAPSAPAMAAWLAHSPFRGIGIYIGGQDRACAQANLTAAWVSAQVAAGWRLIPLYVGPQISFHEVKWPIAQATTAAQDAVAQAALLGLGPGTPIYYDMEAYPPKGAAKALAFFSAWTQALHHLGYRSGIYSSSLSGVADLARNYRNPAYVMPDIIYDAWWNDVPDTVDPVLPVTAWPGHRRVHQYSGNLTRHWGGFKINIDRDYMDVQLAGGGARVTRGHWARAPGGLRFAQLAAMNGTTWFRLHDPALPGDFRLTTRYLGRDVPKGTRWWVPPHQAMSVARRVHG
jgi:hypothetical protein